MPENAPLWSNAALLDLCRMICAWEGDSNGYIAILQYAHRIVVEDMRYKESEDGKRKA